MRQAVVIEAVRTPVARAHAEKGAFRDVSTRAGLAVETRFVGWGAAIQDLDNDGLPDLFFTTPSYDGLSLVMLRLDRDPAFIAPVRPLFIRCPSGSFSRQWLNSPPRRPAAT